MAWRTDAESRPQGDRAEWTVPVLDAVLGRPLDLVVAAVDGRVVVVPPTAVGYVVPPGSIERYREALQTAYNVAGHQMLINRMDPGPTRRG